MDNHPEIKWRDASEDEFEYIKEKYARPTAALTAGNTFLFLLMVAAVIFVICCNTKKHDIGAIICSVIVYAVMLILMAATVYAIMTDIRRVRCIRKRKFLVTDATVQNVAVQVRSRGRTRAKVQFMTVAGVQLNMNSHGLEPLAEKGKHALIINFGRPDAKDPVGKH